MFSVSFCGIKVKIRVFVTPCQPYYFHNKCLLTYLPMFIWFSFIACAVKVCRHLVTFQVVSLYSQFVHYTFKRPVVEKKAPADSCATVCSSDTQSSSFTSCSSSQTSHTQKAKVLDTCLPSLKRRRLSEYTDDGCGLMFCY